MNKQYEPKMLKKLQRVEFEILQDVAHVCEENGIDYFILYGTLIGALRHKGFIPWDDDIDIGMFREDYERLVSVFDKNLSDKYILMTPFRDKHYCSSIAKIEKKGTIFISEVSASMKCEQGIFIDIFIFDKVSGDEKLFRKQNSKTRFYAKMLFLTGSGKPEIDITGFLGAFAKVVCRIAHGILRLIPNMNQFLFRKFEYYSKLSNHEDTDIYTTYQDTDAALNVVNRNMVFPTRKVDFENGVVNIPKESHRILTMRYGDYMKLPDEKDRVNHAAELIDFGE